MASSELCIRFATEHPRWDPSNPHLCAAISLAYDISDRRGFDVFSCDSEIIDSIFDSWSEIIGEVILELSTVREKSICQRLANLADAYERESKGQPDLVRSLFSRMARDIREAIEQ